MSNDTAPAAPITDAERRRRQAAVNFARASVGLEGFKPSPADEALAVRFINGEVDFPEVIAAVKEQR